ncbi:hypothetical protein BKA61DRAFT_615099 [Leptodontidium sp. MPI-SDFR-AT-0119]|nr:hypothetical protein BKA61DRAFT_615099 [Leptodontidium sp. MPI-SDFR-AT-0119]
MWVIQEAVFSKGWDQKAFCGDLEIPYVIIHVSAEWISYQRWSAFPTKRGLLPAITLAQARGEANHTTLEDLLLLTAHFQSTDPRDKLFALLGFAAECQRSIGVPEALQPNYLISASEAFARATRYFIESSQSLGVLSHIGIFSEFRERCESPDTEFPTWVPQWHRGKPLQRTVTLASFKDPGDWVHRPVPYSASDNSIFMKSGPTGSSKILGLQGFRLDRIKHVSPVITAQQYVDFSLVSVMWREYASKLVHYPTGESLLRSFSLTMLVDANIQHEVASKDPKHDADFASYLVTWDVTKLSNLGKEYHDALLLNSTKGDGHRYGVAASNATVGRSFCITESGWMGICPPTAKPGDLICILFGGNVLYLLRRKRGHSIFIGNCYIHGRMDGDAMREQIRRHSPAEAFELR